MAENNFHFEEEEEVDSYGKLEGPYFKKFIHKLTVYLGRDPNTELFDNTDEQSIFIGDSQKISRRHAKLYWNYEKGHWEIQILSKNKAVINGQILRNIDNPMAVPPCSAIKIDKYKFYFFPATAISG
jgi:hypothetical protein